MKSVNKLVVLLFMSFTMFVLFVSAITVLFCKNTIAGNLTDNGNGTVTDNVTGLVWQQEDTDTKYTWEEAMTCCEDTLTLAGYSDWRLPSREELVSIVDYDTFNPSIDSTTFPNTNISYHWSSATSANNTSYAWIVNFYNGYVTYTNKSYNNYVRCVRDGQ